MSVLVLKEATKEIADSEVSEEWGEQRERRKRRKREEKKKNV